MLTIFLKEGPTPYYIQIYESLKEAIITGKFKAGEKLPSKRNLANHLNVSQMTILNAYHQLQEEGYIYSKEKSGYFVEEASHLTFLEPLPKFKTKVNLKDEAFENVEPELFPFDTLKKLSNQLFSEKDERFLKQSPPEGDESLRKEIARYLSSARGFQAEVEQIIVRPSTEDLFALLFLLFDEKKSLAIENPGYHQLLPLFYRNTKSLLPIPLDEDGLDVTYLNQTEANLLYLTPTHQFPSGTIMPIKRRYLLLEWAVKKDGFIIEDDYDSEFKYKGQPIPSLKSLDKSDRVIYMGNFSKLLSPALRISYMVLPKRLYHTYLEKRETLHCHNDVISQRLLALFIEGGYFERHINRLRNYYRKKQEWLKAYLLSKDESIYFHGASAGLHLVFTPKRKKLPPKNSLIKSIKDYSLDEKEAFPLILSFLGETEENLKKAIDTYFEDEGFAK